MSELLNPHKTERDWMVSMTPEMAKEAGVAENSFLIFYLGEGLTRPNYCCLRPKIEAQR